MADESRPSRPEEELAEAGREYFRRGWLAGGGANFSVLLARKPARLWITSPGRGVDPTDDANFFEIDDDAEILQGFGRPSDETLLHLAVYRHRPRARCVLYSRSVAGTIVADAAYVDGSMSFKGYEILKGLSGVNGHEHAETVPVVENSGDLVALAHVIENVLIENASIHAIYLRRHGLFTWGETVAEAMRNTEIFEFLFEVTERSRSRS